MAWMKLGDSFYNLDHVACIDVVTNAGNNTVGVSVFVADQEETGFFLFHTDQIDINRQELKNRIENYIFNHLYDHGHIIRIDENIINPLFKTNQKVDK